MKRTIGIVVLIIVVAVAAFYLGRSTQGPATAPEQKFGGRAYPGAEKHEITLAEARELIKSYTASMETKTANKVLKTSQYSKCVTFERSAFDKILSNPECASLRFYFTSHPDGMLGLVCIGVDSTNHDMTRWMIMDRGGICPPACSMPSELIP